MTCFAFAWFAFSYVLRPKPPGGNVVQLQYLNVLATTKQAVHPKPLRYNTQVARSLPTLHGVHPDTLRHRQITRKVECGKESDDGNDSERPREEDDEEQEVLLAMKPVAAVGSCVHRTYARAPSLEPVVVLSVQEHLGPLQEEDEEFAKELANITTETPAAG
ncbi:hypothetical protein EDD15DRAFT_2193466 [Pisolithus albus]|nr:hypothetical protein EDD15DRAFT_2193466 [Pisolithus albus]